MRQTVLCLAVLGICQVDIFAQDDAAKINTQPETIPFTAPAEALRRMKVPEGFHVELFSHEPQVTQPISLTFDERGRLWIAENHTYAEREVNFAADQRDRIVILEDADGDGRCDKRTVFWDQAQKLTSVEVGFGGVWALCAPQLLFIPDRDRNDVPDGPPVVVLDGWEDSQIRHNIVNGLKWGPDGWLYGRHGIQATSFVGPPGASESQRTRLNCCIWRYHPQKKTFEVVAQGGTNAWGFDYDPHGQMFFINTVIGHLWHVVPGAHYRRMYGSDFNPHLFGLIEQTADHFHWDTRETWSDIRKLGITDTTSAAGGGHAHCGLMIYQGDDWPEAFRGHAFAGNLHGLRINRDRLERQLAGYVGKHEPDFLFAGDPWFRAIDLISGPDGGVYIADWSDIGECHENDGVHRTSGRIYKVAYQKQHPSALAHNDFDLSTWDDIRLVDLHWQANDWWVRQARRVLQERAAAGRDLSRARSALLEQYAHVDVPGFGARAVSSTVCRLRAMWCLWSIGAVDDDWLLKQLSDPDEHVRTWAVRLLSEQEIAPNGIVANRLATLAKTEPSGLVQLFLASALQRLPADARWEIVEALARRSEFVEDRALPLMVWYGLEPAVPGNAERAVRLLAQTPMDVVRWCIARRLALEIDSQPHAVERLLTATANSRDEHILHDVLHGMSEALRGWSKAPQPKAWSAVADRVSKGDDDELKSLARELSVVFGDGRAVDELRALVANAKVEPTQRQQALRTLVAAKPSDLPPQLFKWLDDRDLLMESLRGLAAYDHPETARRILDRFGRLNADARSVAVNTLVARPQFAKALLAAVGDGRVPRHELSAFHARQILSFGDESLAKELSRVWGEVRSTSADKQQLAARFKSTLTAERLAKAHPSEGRTLFQRTCANCHVLFGSGKSAGPDLTGGNRRNLDYLLENLLDPSATVAADFRMTVFAMKDGRVINGVVVEQTEKTLSVQTQNERITIPRAEIDEQRASTLSLMPDGLLQNLSDEQVCDLIAYLMSPAQVPLPETIPERGPSAP
jgi:putative membrane-bound dehydrogenase-like protein